MENNDTPPHNNAPEDDTDPLGIFPEPPTKVTEENYQALADRVFKAVQELD